MKKVLWHLNSILDIHKEDAAALPGSVVEFVRKAKKKIETDPMMQKEKLK